MFVVRDIMYCKPGNVRPLVEKFKQMNKLMKKKGFKEEMRIMTDLSSERFWMLVAETETANIDEFMESMRSSMADKDFQKVMKDYHEFVTGGRREIYTLEK